MSLVEVVEIRFGIVEIIKFDIMAVTSGSGQIILKRYYIYHERLILLTSDSRTLDLFRVATITLS